MFEPVSDLCSISSSLAEWLDGTSPESTPRYQNANWQVIYITKAGLEFCRETYSRGKPLNRLIREVETEIHANPRLGSARIERF